jgi:predicted ATP-dependent serine protease
VNGLSVFAMMTEHGLREVSALTRYFYRIMKNKVAGGITVTMEGTRPLLIEIQTLSRRKPCTSP